MFYWNLRYLGKSAPKVSKIGLKFAQNSVGLSLQNYYMECGCFSSTNVLTFIKNAIKGID